MLRHTPRPLGLPPHRSPRASRELGEGRHGPPFTVEELRSAVHDVVATNGIASCYLRPLAFYGYGELGVSSVGNPVDVVVISFPWGAYLGEESQTAGITTKISTWERVGPNVIPHVAKATGIYLNSMLATMEARRGGYDEAIMLSHDGYIADGPGENIFVVKDGVLYTPPLAMSILPGVTRDTIIQIAHDLGHRVEERCSSAPTSTSRTRCSWSDRDRGGPGASRRRPRDRRRPVTRELQQRTSIPSRDGPSAGTTGSTSSRCPPRRHSSSHGVRPDDPPRAVARRAGDQLVSEVLGSGRLSLGPTIDRFEEAFAEAVGAPYAAAVSSGTAGLHLLCIAAGVGPGDEVVTSPYSFVASASCAIYEGHAGVR